MIELAMLELRRRRLAAGELPLGWKVGFGAPAAMAKFGTDRPLVGFLLHSGLLADGATVAVGEWKAPHIEAEVAVHLGEDATIDGLSVAIELADTDPPPADPATIVAGNIFHRHVMLGPRRGLVPPSFGRLLCDGQEVARTDDPAGLTGGVDYVVGSVAETLAACGEELKPGEVIITGSIVAPLPCEAGQHWEVELDQLGRLAVTLSIG